MRRCLASSRLHSCKTQHSTSPVACASRHALPWRILPSGAAAHAYVTTATTWLSSPHLTPRRRHAAAGVHLHVRPRHLPACRQLPLRQPGAAAAARPDAAIHPVHRECVDKRTHAQLPGWGGRPRGFAGTSTAAVPPASSACPSSPNPPRPESPARPLLRAACQPVSDGQPGSGLTCRRRVPLFVAAQRRQPAGDYARRSAAPFSPQPGQSPQLSVQSDPDNFCPPCSTMTASSRKLSTR